MFNSWSSMKIMVSQLSNVWLLFILFYFSMTPKVFDKRYLSRHCKFIRPYNICDCWEAAKPYIIILDSQRVKRLKGPLGQPRFRCYTVISSARHEYIHFKHSWRLISFHVNFLRGPNWLLYNFRCIVQKCVDNLKYA